MREQRKDGREITFANNKNVQVARRKLFEKFQVHVDLHVVKENLKTLKKALAQNYVCSEALVMACQARHSNKLKTKRIDNAGLYDAPFYLATIAQINDCI